MEPNTTTTQLTYEEALEIFLSYDANYAGGLANHGPMAAEALVSLGLESSLGSFVAQYRARLEPASGAQPTAPLEWRDWLRPVLLELVPMAGNLAGHGLLRVAHAVRGLERSELAGAVAPVQLLELATGVDYWRSGGPGVAGPNQLSGMSAPSEWLPLLGRLDPEQRSDGLLTFTLQTASETAGFADGLAAMAPAADPRHTLDGLASTAADAFRRNRASSAFALLHGVTVPSMATVLLAHLEEDGARQLEASVAAFVVAALIGFDDHEPTVADDVTGEGLDPIDLAARAAATNEDHTIKFADACIRTTERTGNKRPLVALEAQILSPYGV